MFASIRFGKMRKAKELFYSKSFVQLIKYVLIGVLGLVVDFDIF